MCLNCKTCVKKHRERWGGRIPKLVLAVSKSSKFSPLIAVILFNAVRIFICVCSACSQPRALQMRGNHSTTGLCPQPFSVSLDFRVQTQSVQKREVSFFLHLSIISFTTPPAPEWQGELQVRASWVVLGSVCLHKPHAESSCFCVHAKKPHVTYKMGSPGQGTVRKPLFPKIWSKLEHSPVFPQYTKVLHKDGQSIPTEWNWQA